MPRIRTDHLWFGLAASLLALGVVAWWAIPPASGLFPRGDAMLALWLSTGGIVVCGWRLTSAPDALDARFMASMALASTAPLSMLPLVGASGPATAVAMVAGGLAALPLGWALAGRLVDPIGRSRARVLLVLAAAGGVLLGLAFGAGADGLDVRFGRWLLVATSVGLPTVLAALESLRGHQRVAVPAQQRLLEAMTLLTIGFVPTLAGLSLLPSSWPQLLLPLLAAVVTAALLARFAVQPLARLASSATVQRDRVVEATEAERTRLASVLHDGPLADITLLVQLLDDRHEVEGAAIARSIAHELRSIGSELRLPILDDLGTGPALEWLVGRLAQRSGAVVRLEHSTVVRPPPPVELAAYRVAQEALVNALKHGAAPITVRYRATLDGVALSVDDSGPGLDPGAPVRAEREGRLGLSSMGQRAEAIGARLTLSARPGGGTHVGLEWTLGTA
jgi:signal transduction histidine kinase